MLALSSPWNRPRSHVRHALSCPDVVMLILLLGKFFALTHLEDTDKKGIQFGFENYLATVDNDGPYWFWAHGDKLVVPPGWTDRRKLSTQFYAGSDAEAEGDREISYDMRETGIVNRIWLEWNAVDGMEALEFFSNEEDELDGLMG
jgi:hypothetical protein